MNRRTMIKSSAATGIALALGGPTVVMQIACESTKQLAAWTATVVAVLRDVSPILAEMGAGSIAAVIARALPVAESLKKAFQKSDGASALTLLDQLINPQTGLIVEIANQVGLLANDGRKKIVLGLLAIGQVTLHLISAQIQRDAAPATVAAARKSMPAAAKSVELSANSDSLERAFQAARF